MQSLLWIVLVAFSFTFLGCSQNSDQSNSLQDIHSNKNQSIPKTEVRVDLLDTAKWQEIKSLNKGKVLFVNIWATWCLPCKEEFPDLVKLAEEYQNSDVVIIGVSVDYPDEIEEQDHSFSAIHKRLNFQIMYKILSSLKI